MLTLVLQPRLGNCRVGASGECCPQYSLLVPPVSRYTFNCAHGTLSTTERLMLADRWPDPGGITTPPGTWKINDCGSVTVAPDAGDVALIVRAFPAGSVGLLPHPG